MNELETNTKGSIPRRRALRALALLSVPFFLFVLAGQTPAQGQDASAPAKPTGLTASVTYNSVTLTWDDPQDPSITGYQVLRRDKSIHDKKEFATHVEDTGSAALTYTDTDVVERGKYTYRIIARNSAGLSPRSSFADVTIPEGPPEVSVSFAKASYSVDEGGSVTIEVTLNQDPERTVVVDLSATNQGGASDDDHSVVPASVTFNGGDTSASFSFSAIDDTEDDDGESVTISIDSTLPDRVSFGAHNSTTVSITDNDDAPAPVDADATRDGAINLGDITGRTKAQFSKHDIDGEDDQVDYFRFSLTRPMRVTLGLRQLDYDADLAVEDSSGKTRKSTSKSGTSDEAIATTLLEGVYFIRVEAKEAGENEYALRYGVAEPDPKKVDEERSRALKQSVTEVAVSFKRSSYTVDEIDDVDTSARKENEVTIEVTLNEDPNRTVTIPIVKTNQDGASDSDYSGVPDNVTFNSGDTSASFTFSATDDTDVDVGESVLLAFGTLPEGVTAGTNSQATVSITDDDAPEVRVSFRWNSNAVTEGDSVEVTLVLDRDPERTIEVPIRTRNRSGASDDDYSGNPSEVTFNAGETSQSFTLTAEEDIEVDDEEEVRFELRDSDQPYRVRVGGTSRHTVTIDDATTPQITVKPWRTTIAEGESGSFTVVLNTQPSEEVTITVSVQIENGLVAVDDATLTRSTLTFDSSNWDEEQTVGVTPAHDTNTENKVVYIHFSGDSHDLNYDFLHAQRRLQVDVVDDDSVLTFTASPEDVLEGESVRITATLHRPAFRDVTVPIVVTHGQTTDADIGPVPSSITFQKGDTEQTFTITTVDDTDDERDEFFLISGNNPAQGIFSSDFLAIDILDDETTVFFVHDKRTVREGRTVEVWLQLGDFANVVYDIPITVTNKDGATDADYSGVPAVFRFEVGEGDSTSFTFRAIQDKIDDDGEKVEIGFGTLPANVTAGERTTTVVSITDNDTAGVILDPDSPTVTEGTPGSFNVKLRSQPLGDVTVTFTETSDHFNIAGGPLTFSPTDWNTNQQITITPADDDDANDHTGTITVRITSSDDSIYNGLADITMNVTINDDDERGVVLSKQTVMVDEDDGTATYNVRLGAAPTGNVTVSVTSVDPTVATVDTSADPGNQGSLTFTTNNWKTDQTVTVTGVDNDIDETNRTATIVHNPAGADYNSVANATLTVTATDDDTLGVTLDPESPTVTEGTPGTFDVKLDSQPTGDVTVTFTESSAHFSINGSPRTFTSTDWNKAQRITITPRDDDDANDHTGTITASITSSGDAAYDGLANINMNVTINDDEGVGVTLDPASPTVTEGTPGSFNVKLRSQPLGDVTVTFSENSDHFNISADPLTFTTANWNTNQRITITPTVDDDANDHTGTITASITSEDDSDYDDLANINMNVTIRDDDEHGLEISDSTVSVDEDGGTATYKVSLTSKPTGTVTVTVTSNATGVATVDTSADDGNQSTLTFTTNNWATDQTVTVTGVNDDVDNSTDRTATITHDPAGADYGSVANATVTVTATDDDTRGVTVSESALTVAEDGGTARYTVVLDSEPTSTVTVNVSSNRTSNATVNKRSLTFSPSTWDTEQEVTVTGVNDDIENATARTTSITHTVGGGDYGSVTAPSVSVTLTDDDMKGVVLSKQTVTVAEDGGTATYKVRLGTVPTGTVTVTVTSGDTSVATVDTSTDDGNQNTLTFTTNNWKTDQTVTVTGVDNDIGETDRTAMITHDPAGADYGSVANATLTVTATDDDTPGVTVNPAGISVVAGRSNTYTVVLDSEPTATVTVTVTVPSGKGLSVDKPSLTFTPSTWDDKQTLRVTAGSAAGAGTTAITHSAAGGGYGSVDVDDLSVTVIGAPRGQLIQVGVTTTAQNLVVPEGESTDYSIVLGHQPAGDVTITISLPSGNDLSVDRTSLTFTTGNWDDEQEVEVRAAEDDDAIADPKVTITHEASGGGYDDANVPDVGVTITENDSAGISVDPTELTIPEGRSRTYRVMLDSRPAANVVVTVNTPADNTDVTASGTLTFTPDSWNRGQRVTVRAEMDDDAVEDTATVTHTSVSTDTDYNGLTVDDVEVTVTDDDDVPVKVSFERTSYSVKESDDTSTTDEQENQVTIKVTLSEDPERTITVPMSSLNFGGAKSGDYTVDPRKLTFRSGETEKTFTFTATHDLVDERGEWVKLGFRNLPAGVGPGPNENALVKIHDDDASLSFESTSASVDEGSSIRIVVKLSQAMGSDVEVPVRAIRQGRTSAGDFTVDEETITFAAGEDQQTITFNALADDVRDPGEMVLLTLGARDKLPAGVEPHAPYTFEVTILDVEHLSVAPIALEVSVSRDSLREANASTDTATITITRADGHSFSTGQHFTVNLRGTATPGTDYTVTPADADTSTPGHQVTVGQAADSVTLTLAPVDDSAADPCDSVVASAMLDDKGVEVFPQLLLTIVDNDNSTVTTALSMGLNNLIVGKITAADNGKDWYSFTATANTKYIIEVKQPLVFLGYDRPAAGGTAMTVPGYMKDPATLEIIDALDSQVLGEHDLGGFTGNYARAFFTPGTAGTYRIAVGGGRENRQGLGCYTISVRADDHADDYRTKVGNALKPGKSITGSIDSDVAPDSTKLNTWDWFTGSGLPEPRQGVETMDDRDVIRVNITEAGEYEFALTGQPTGVGIWRILNQNGGAATATQEAPVTSWTLHLDEGRYYVEIGTPYSSSGNTGAYTISLTKK